MGSVLGSFGAFQAKIWSIAPFIPVGDWEGPKISILPYWNFFGGWPLPSFSDIVIDPKGYFWCDFNKFKGYVFEKNWFFCIPYFGQKRPFFGPEGPILTQNLKNHGVTSYYKPKQSIPRLKLVSERKWQFWGCQTPPNHPRAPQSPPGVQRAQKWL